MVGKVISHYRVLEELGGGGMGVVYKAEDTKLKRTVALKFLPPDLTRDPEAKRRFVQEAQAASALDHPNICTIHEIDETDDGQLFMSMACYEGETLKEKIEGGPLQLQEAVDITRQVAQGLAKAHSRGIVHRDIKPANIFITDDGQVKILDFGLAKLAGETRITETGTTAGTVAYMSPEQGRGEDVDHRTDIWSLGAVFYEMLTGELPFKGENWEAVLYSIFNDEPQLISDLRGDVPAGLQRVVDTMIEKDVRSRHADMAALVADLRSVDLEGEVGGEAGVIERRPSASIAVLPFVDMSAERDQEYFCDGMAEDLINALAHIKDLRVVARTSAFAFRGKDVGIREIGRKLKVDTVLEGSVRRAGDRLRITAQLVNVADGYHLWSERYDRVMKDVFEVQDEISLEIADKLKVRLVGEEKAAVVKRHTQDLEAYHLYLKGRYFSQRMTEEDLNNGIHYYERAIKTDPQYAVAYAGLSNCHSLLGYFYYLHPRDVFPKARAAAAQALEKDGTLSVAHQAAGLVKLLNDWDWEGAEREFKRAIELNPRDPAGHSSHAAFLAVTGKLDKAIEGQGRALDLDPLSVMYAVTLSMYLLRANRTEEARHEARKALEFAPNSTYGHWLLGQTYVLESRFDEAITEIENALDLSDRFPAVLAALGWTYAVSGRADQARKVLKELKRQSKRRYVGPFFRAKIYGGLGEKDKAFEWLDKAFQARDTSVIHLLTDETMGNLRSDPRFEELLKKVRLGVAGERG